VTDFFAGSLINPCGSNGKEPLAKDLSQRIWLNRPNWPSFAQGFERAQARRPAFLNLSVAAAQRLRWHLSLLHSAAAPHFGIQKLISPRIGASYRRVIQFQAWVRSE
jgi:hypothetical protein